MTLEYHLGEKDFMAYQLYSASRSAAIRKKIKISRMVLGISAAAFAALFFFSGQPALAVYFLVMAAVMAVFYPAYFKWYSRGQYRRYIRKNYKDRIGIHEKVTLTPKSIVAEDKIGQAKLKLSEIERIVETQNHFFLLIDGSALIIPKDKVENPDRLRKEFSQKGLKIDDERDWKW